MSITDRVESVTGIQYDEVYTCSEGRLRELWIEISRQVDMLEGHGYYGDDNWCVVEMWIEIENEIKDRIDEGWLTKNFVRV